jgi:formylmethanofuran:tetrahydromethanopterin formyltransferase
MKIPTLGFEDDTKIYKKDIAKVQLIEAIELFIENNFVCAITLAGASEAVLSGILTAKGELTATEQSVNAIENLRNTTTFEVMESRPKNKIYNLWNSARNTMKHHNKNEADFVVVNLFDEAYWLIQRALSNASKLDIKIENQQEFENWCIVNIHL